MNFFEKNNLKAYDYQIDFITNHFSKIKEKKKILFAAAPGAGKTITSIACIENFLIENKDSRVLVLTHNQNVLKEQFYDSITEHKVSFTHSKHIDSDAQVVVTIPAALSKKESLPKFDLIIVDEAHHFYETKNGKGMVETIINKTDCKYQLLLTGSPSKFNGRGTHTFAVTINDLYDRGQCSDVIIELATANFSASYNDYNSNYELTNEAADRETEEDVNITLDNILNKIQKRLMSWHKNNPELYSKLDRNAGWLPALGQLKKTIFACKSIRQADRVSNYLTKKGINNVVSHSGNDKDSEKISTFRNDKSCLVLIVVDRGTLGFNMKELENIIDMTGSQNIDRITQLLCRVNRVHPEIKKKLFIKVSPINQVDYMHAIMTAVVCMFDKEWYLRYNGKNFLDIIVPIIKEKRERKGEMTGKASKSKKVKMVDFIGLPAIEFFKTLNHKRDDAFSGVEYTTIAEVRTKLFGIKYIKSLPKGYWTLEKCKENALKYNRKSDWFKNSASTYGIAKIKGWFDECTSHMQGNISWTLEKCKEDALKYKTPTEWRENSSAYSAAHKNNWIDECTSHMKKITIWTLEMCKIDALKFKNPTQWRKGNINAYSACKRNKWLEECTSHMTKLKRWTLEECKKDALKYDNLTEWVKQSNNIYQAAYKKGWLDECTSHMERRFMSKKWTLESCIDDLNKYNTYTEWLNNSTAYNAAIRNKWLDEIKKTIKTK